MNCSCYYYCTLVHCGQTRLIGKAFQGFLLLKKKDRQSTSNMIALKKNRIRTVSLAVLFIIILLTTVEYILDQTNRNSILFTNLQFDLVSTKHYISKPGLQTLLSNSNIYKEKLVNCSAVFSGEAYEVEKAVNISKNISTDDELPLTAKYYINATKNCDTFLSTRGYIMDSMTTEEKEFPLAYSVLIFKDIEMFERLLRAIYRPQNHYCIHVDAKSSTEYLMAVQSIVKCLPSAFLAPKLIHVKWGEFSVLEPEIICMRALFRHKFKYFINLTGQEFPLKNNWELVKILTAYNGANDLEGTVKRWRANRDRWKSSAPHGILLVKGSVHIVVNRDFVDYVLHNKIAQDFLNWTRYTHVPDETFFATLNHNPQLGIPGTYKGEPETDPVKKPFLTRFKNWNVEPAKWPCAGKIVRSICILSTGDLPLLANRREMFANKFHLDEDRIVIGCLEEKLYNDTRDEYLGKVRINASFYAELSFVKNQVRKT